MASVDASAKQMNLWQKLAAVRNIADVIMKNRSGFNYKYVTEDEILSKVKAGMSKYAVSVYPSIVQNTFRSSQRDFLKKKFDKATKIMVDEPQTEFTVESQLEMIVINDDNPQEMIRIPWAMIGTQSDVAQAYGAALTYANRYFFLKFFNIATPDSDPDEWKRKKEEAGMADELDAVKIVIKNIDDLIRGREFDKESRSSLATLLKKYIVKDGKPSSDYMSIKSLDVAKLVYAEVSKFINVPAQTSEADATQENNK